MVYHAHIIVKPRHARDRNRPSNDRGCADEEIAVPSERVSCICAAGPYGKQSLLSLPPTLASIKRQRGPQ